MVTGLAPLVLAALIGLWLLRNVLDAAADGKWIESTISVLALAAVSAIAAYAFTTRLP